MKSPASSPVEQARRLELDEKWDEARDAYLTLARVALRELETDDALRYYSKAFRLKKNEPSDWPIKEAVTQARICHALGQFEFLLSKGLLPRKFNSRLAAFRSLLERIQGDSDRQFHIMNWSEREALEPIFSTPMHTYRPNRMKEPAVNPDLKVSEVKWPGSENGPRTFILDDVLTSKAMSRLQKFCQESMIWHLGSSGFVTASTEGGFYCRLLFQIEKELKNVFRKISLPDSLPLTYLWAMSYDSTTGGIPVHADHGQFTVNLWITPDEANLDPESGGLTLYDAKVPKSWVPADYQIDPIQRIQDYLAGVAHRKITIPYRMNRAVLFESKQIHSTSSLKFREGYRNRRINVTFLYGE